MTQGSRILRLGVSALTVAAASFAHSQEALLEACNAIQDSAKRLSCLKDLQSLQRKPLASTVPDSSDLKAAEAEACIDRIRPSLKDPQSATLVSILGSRAMSKKARGDAVWIQYKATNSYGGFLTASILCHPNPSLYTAAEKAQEACMLRLMKAAIDRPGFFASVPGADVRYRESRSEYISRREREVFRAAAREANSLVSGTADLKSL